MNSGSPRNPFAASELEPSATPYVFPHGRSRANYEAQLEEHGWNAELIGPHGVGKSTLLYTLGAFARASGRHVVYFRCSDVHPRLPLAWQLQFFNRVDLICLDGAERISLRQFDRLQRLCRIRNTGLLCTVHAPIRDVLQIPVTSSGQQFSELLRTCAAPAEFWREAPDPNDLLTSHNGCARTALLELYDRYEDWYMKGRGWSIKASTRFVETT